LNRAGEPPSLSSSGVGTAPAVSEAVPGAGDPPVRAWGVLHRPR